ncbi:MAG: sigma-70 family RNA polymerase sigma factor [Ferruginibacter sp.]
MQKTNAKILGELKSGNCDFYGQMYEQNYPLVERFLLKNNGTVDDAKDIFQDIMLVLVEKIYADDFELTASLSTYIFAIGKKLWLKKLRNISYHKEIDLDDFTTTNLYADVTSSIETEMTYIEKLQSLMKKMSAHCYHLLRSMFYLDKKIEDIQNEFGYTSRHNAQNQKYKCLEQAKKKANKQAGKK